LGDDLIDDPLGVEVRVGFRIRCRFNGIRTVEQPFLGQWPTLTCEGAFLDWVNLFNLR
jgi:hypothetical protein